jgi:DNA processing protein
MDVALPDESRAWLTLNRVPGLGSRTCCRLLRRFGNPEALLRAGDAELRGLGLAAKVRTALRRPDHDAVAADLDWLRGPDRGLLTLACPDYPPRLLAIDDPPPVLFLEGRRDALARPGVALVGSRRPTATGVALARRFATELATAGLPVVSGLAAGID